jgi:hypothetical protein
MGRGKSPTSLALIAGRCRELDALSPVTVRERVEAAIRARIDPAAGAVRARRSRRARLPGDFRQASE